MEAVDPDLVEERAIDLQLELEINPNPLFDYHLYQDVKTVLNHNNMSFVDTLNEEHARIEYLYKNMPLKEVW